MLFRSTPYYKFLEENKLMKPYVAFVDKVIAMRRLIGNSLAADMGQALRNIVAISRTNILTTSFQQSSSHNFNSTQTQGVAGTMANILLHHKYTLEDIYKAIRNSGCPTGDTFDHYDALKEIPDLFPPVSDPNFLANLSIYTRDGLRENMQKKDKENYEKHLTEVIAAFISLGTLRDGKMHFSKKPKFDYNTQEDFEHPAYRKALGFTLYKPKEEMPK